MTKKNRRYNYNFYLIFMDCFKYNLLVLFRSYLKITSNVLISKENQKRIDFLSKS